MASTTPRNPPVIWWNNVIFFCGTHLAAAYGIYRRPLSTVPGALLVATIVLFQLAMFGITIGYHRLYSHRAFIASFGVRAVLALIGASAFQGSIKWWYVNNLKRSEKLDKCKPLTLLPTGVSDTGFTMFTDDEENDPYCATRGLLFSHVGWIFFKPTYTKLYLIERDDLEQDPIVRWQHRYFVPIAVVLGILFPTVLGATYGDIIGGFIYPGLVARILTWHCTFFVNSLAHWDGLQPYTDENTSRTNLFLALVTAGEGNHNFHAFPHDYRSGPAKADWDPSKWVIFALSKLGVAWGLRRAIPEDIATARAHMLARDHDHNNAHEIVDEKDEWTGPKWTEKELKAYMERNGTCVLLIDGYVIDVTGYMKTHPGGMGLLREYAVPIKGDGGSDKWKEATWAFNGGVNKHSQVGRRKLRQLRVASLMMHI